MAKVEFARNYDHEWPSRAVTAYSAGWSGTVRQEVAEAAEAAGVLVTAKRKRGRPPRAKAPVVPAPLPPADDPAAVEIPAPGAEGEPDTVSGNIVVDADSNSD